MTYYLNLPDDKGKLEQLVSLAGSEVLDGPPLGLDDVPTGKALVCVADMGAYDAAGYILFEADLANWTRPGDPDPKTWLLIDQQTAEALCPEAPGQREFWDQEAAEAAEAAAHTDNLIPVARASRLRVRQQIELLRRWADSLLGEKHGDRYDQLLTEAGIQRIAAADLRDVANHLESWIDHDWIGVIDIGPERQHLAGPLPPFPGSGGLGGSEGSQAG